MLLKESGAFVFLKWKLLLQLVAWNVVFGRFLYIEVSDFGFKLWKISFLCKGLNFFLQDSLSVIRKGKLAPSCISLLVKSRKVLCNFFIVRGG